MNENTTTSPGTAEAALPPAICSALPWKGPLVHDRSPGSDWGMIRDEVGYLIFIARPERGEYSDYANECRRNGIDPCQSRVDALMAGFKALDLMDWTETLLCNAEHPKHCTAEEWSKLVHEWRELRPRLPNDKSDSR